MVRNIIINRILLLAVLSGSTILYSCKDDVFNSEKVKATYQDKFPVKDIDPSMDWKMTRQISAHVAVSEDAGVDYSIRIYDQNPLTEQSTAKLLAEGNANNETPFNTTMDCPNILTGVFVCCIDAHNRATAKYVTITNQQINATFGKPVITRAVTKEIEIPEIETFSPSLSATEVTKLLSQATEITSKTDFKNGGVYKISKGNTYTGTIQKQLNFNTPARIIIEGTWKPEFGIELENGYILYILNNGSITLGNTSLIMKGATYFNVYQGGKISGGINSRIEPTNSSQGNYNYNAGTINVGSIINGGSNVSLYNDRTGTIQTNDLNFNTQNAKFINYGVAQIGDSHDNTVFQNANQLTLTNLKGQLINRGRAIIEKADANTDIKSNCYLEVKLLMGDLTLGNNCAAIIDEYTTWGGKDIIIGDNSMITINQAMLAGTKFAGSPNHPSLIKIGKITNDPQLGPSSLKNSRLYFEFQNVKDAWFHESWRKFDQLSNISKWNEAPVFIPSGECTGNGNTPKGEGTIVPSDPISYTYVFEDNFPMVGDYDFNDVVLDVNIIYHRNNKNNQIKQVRLDVTLTALGATKLLGAGLRIVNISKSDIQRITPAGDYEFFYKTLTTANNLFKFNTSNYMEDGDNSVVLPLFGNAHKVFDGVEQGQMVNTSSSGIIRTSPTYSINIELADQTKVNSIISKDNLDFFICYPYKNMEKRMEVHLYEFWNKEATAAGTVQKQNLELAGNNTWAVCVPNFRYPKERTNISNQANKSDCAYPEFLDWARNRETNTDWYLHPIEDNVYR